MAAIPLCLSSLEVETRRVAQPMSPTGRSLQGPFLAESGDVGVLPDGTVLWEEDCTDDLSGGHGVLIRHVRTDGKIETIAGAPANGYISSACLTAPCIARQQSFGSPGHFGVGIDGTIYFGDWAGTTCTVWRVTTDGILHHFGGLGTCDHAKGDGGPALAGDFNFPGGMRVDGTSLLVADLGNNAIRSIDGDGIVETIAGDGASLLSGGLVNGAPATSSGLSPLKWSDPTRSPDGYIYLITQLGSATWGLVRVGAPPGSNALTAGHTLVLSSDASELFEFDALGRHVATRSPLRGATLYAFGYNSANQLTSVTDVAGNIVNITYSGNTVTISSTHDSAKFTTLTLDASSHYLTQVENANSESFAMTYLASQPGLLATFTTPNAQQHSFTYDSFGLLKSDISPLTGSPGTQLTSSNTSTSRVVDILTPEGRDTKHTISYADSTSVNSAGASLIESRTHVDPVGMTTTESTYSDGSHTIIDPDGTTTTTTLTSDPRFGFAAPRESGTTIVTGSGATKQTTELDDHVRSANTHEWQ